jgi:type I restriction enzyme M protein
LPPELEARDEEVLQQSIFGVEKKSLPHMLCTTNMILHGIDTHPPFGGMEEDGIEKNFPADLRTRETADLFMALIIRRLKDGGRAAIVLSYDKNTYTHRVH